MYDDIKKHEKTRQEVIDDSHITPEIEELISSFSAKIDRPNGECYDASIALGILLACKGLPVKLIHGDCGGRDHWWLQHKETKIDPTFHQFEEGAEYDNRYVSHHINFELIAGYLGLEI